MPNAFPRPRALVHGLLDDSGKAEVEGLPVPVLDALVREFIEAHMDLDILEAVKRAEPKMRTDAAKIAQQLLRQPD